MIEFIKSWASGIIVAVIIATLIEMILPENKNKKYIKTVIGIYILFTIISPIISNALIDGKLDVSSSEKYLSFSEDYNDLATDFEVDNTSNIQKIYEEQLKADIKKKLKAKGFEVIKADVEFITDQTDEYGKLRTLNLSLSKAEKSQEENTMTNEISINKIKIGNSIKQEKNKETNSKITENEKEELKKYLKEEYGIEKENMTIQ